MIDPALDTVFPDNVVECLSIVLPGIDPDVTLLQRPLRPSDPSYSIGVYGTLWQPNEQSYEMGRNAPSEPTLNNYQIGIQTLIKDGDSERGLKVSSIFTKRVRSVLYRNEPLRVALGMLVTDDGLSREHFRRSGIRSQRFMSNDIEGKFIFISVLDYWIETEMH